MLIEVLTVAAALVFFYLLFNLQSNEPKNLPPGPRPLPFIGNFHNIVGSIPYVHLGFCNLAKKYGKVFTVYLQGQRIVVINSASIAREALITSKEHFAGRPYVFTGDYITRNSKDIVFADSSPRLLLMRKIAIDALRLFNPHAGGTIQLEVEELIKRIISHGSEGLDVKNDIQLAIMNVVCAALYGQRYEVNDPEFLKCIFFTDKACEIAESTSMLSMFPWMIHLPFVKATREIKEVCKVKDEILNRKYREHQASFIEGQTRDLTDALLNVKLQEERRDSTVCDVITDDHVIMTMQDVFIAGSESSSSTLRWILAQLITYPEVQARLHAEIDDVIGLHRMPEVKDRVNLPYLEAVVAEVSRLKTAIPLAIPHKATCDTTLRGYQIPKDTMVILNMWAIHHDEEKWENPGEFKPERFLDSEGKVAKKSDLSYMPFGAGRRMCLGEGLAKQMLFLVLAGLLQRFELLQPPDSPLPDQIGYSGIVAGPKPFKLCFRDRMA